MLEEAAGIAGLHVRRKDAEQKLRAAEANLARLEDVLGEMDSRANALRRQARAAERYVALSEAIHLSEARTLYARWRDAATAAEAAQVGARAAEAAVNAAHEAQTASAVHANVALDALTRARTAAQDARDAASEAGHRLAALKAEHAQIVARLADLAGQAARLAEDRAREGALAHDAAEAITRLGEEATTLKARIVEGQSLAPDFATRIAEAQEDVRDAELDLARAMAKQAGEQAELRVAEAALVAARNRLERADRDVKRLEADLASLPDAAPLHAQRDAATKAISAGQLARVQAESDLTDAEASRAVAAETRSQAESALSSANAALAALDAEAAALTRALGSAKSGTSRALDLIRAAPGYEHALAAALGDDLEAGMDANDTRHWAGALNGADDPVLPSGTDTLANHVTAPPQLARRLAQIAVADKDAGQMLAVGQRLVTMTGELRRWDGYVAREGGAATAQRLIRQNRIKAIEDQRPGTAGAVETARRTLDDASAMVVAATQAIASARTALGQAEAQIALNIRERDNAQAMLERIEARAADSAARLADAQSDFSVSLTEYETAQSSRAAMPDGSETRELVMRLSASSEAARHIVSQLQAETALAQRALTADSERLAVADAEAKSWRNRAGEAARRITDMSAREIANKQELETLADRPDALATQIAAMETDAASLAETARITAEDQQNAEATLREAEARHAKCGEALAQARESRAGAVAHAEHADERRREMGRLSGERFECPPSLLPQRIGFSGADVGQGQSEQAELDRLSQERERIGPVNLVAASELAELEETQRTSRAESLELAQAIHQLRGSIGSLNREGRARLLAAFEAVDSHFRRLFTALFNGGQARLELIDSDDPLEAGLEILAQPPGKKLSTLTLLSGGEQALTAIALIFGLFLTNPAPICVLDEVDAPLDDANVERFCDLLDQMVRDTRTRYLIVTHNAVTMARMHRLFGVTMVEKGISRLVSVNLGGAEELLAAE